MAAVAASTVGNTDGGSVAGADSMVLFPGINTLMKQCLLNSEARSSRKRGSTASAQQPSSAGGDVADTLNLA